MLGQLAGTASGCVIAERRLEMIRPTLDGVNPAPSAPAEVVEDNITHYRRRRDASNANSIDAR
jgi:hypothetical protein